MVDAIAAGSSATIVSAMFFSQFGSFQAGSYEPAFFVEHRASSIAGIGEFRFLRNRSNPWIPTGQDVTVLPPAIAVRFAQPLHSELYIPTRSRYGQKH